MSFKVMVTPSIGCPCSSFTVPWIEPSSIWADVVAALPSNATTRTATSDRGVRNVLNKIDPLESNPESELHLLWESGGDGHHELGAGPIASGVCEIRPAADVEYVIEEIQALHTESQRQRVAKRHIERACAETLHSIDHRPALGVELGENRAARVID